MCYRLLLLTLDKQYYNANDVFSMIIYIIMMYLEEVVLR